MAPNIDWRHIPAAIWRGRAGTLRPVSRPDPVRLEDLLGIDTQKAKILQNTERFLRGEPCNHVLLWGSRGTGPGEFGLPHNLVVDDEGRVYVTDRDNQRVQVFSAVGEFLSEWADIGANSALFMTMSEDQQIWTGGTLRNLAGEAVATLPGGNGGHGMTVSGTGEVFVAQLGGRVQKFVE